MGSFNNIFLYLTATLGLACFQIWKTIKQDGTAELGFEIKGGLRQKIES